MKDTIMDLLSKKIKRPLAITYFVFWAARHWQGIVALFFNSENLIFEKTGLLKSQFLENYFGYDPNQPLLSCRNIWFVIDCIIALLFALSFVPLVRKVHLGLFRLQENFRVQEKLIKLEFEKRYTVLEKEVLDKKVENAEKELEADGLKKTPERELYPVVAEILNTTDNIETTELIDLLSEKIELTELDQLKYKGRNDTVFSQTVRNMVSHYNSNSTMKNAMNESGFEIEGNEGDGYVFRRISKPKQSN
jgi:hypothetical protein